MVAVMAIGSAANAAPILDQVNNVTSGSFGGGADFVQQQVTAGITGKLTSFDVNLYDGYAEGYSFFIAAGPAWNTSTHLFDYALPNRDFGLDASLVWISIDTSAAGINLTAGQQFVIGWSMALGGGGSLACSGNNKYVGGDLWWGPRAFGGLNTDLAFRTYVAVPEPATMSLLALGGIATLIRRRRKA